MDTNLHNLTSLFSQLGLDNSSAGINKFVETHHISSTIPLSDAPFWTPAQASFLAESIAEDSDWCEVVDQFDILLRT